MTSQPTDRELHQAAKAMNLVVFPGTEDQRATRANVPSDRPDLMQRAVFVATQKYELRDLAWFHPQDGSFTPVLAAVS